MSPSSVARVGKKGSQSLVFCRRKEGGNANGADAPKKKKDCCVCICLSFALWMRTPKSLLLLDRSMGFGEGDLNKPALYQEQNVTWHLDAVCGSVLGKRRRGKMQVNVYLLSLELCVVMFACLSEIASWRMCTEGRKMMLG